MSLSIYYAFGVPVGGFVYLDSNQNGIKDTNEKGIAGVCVSNGELVVKTDKNGKWSMDQGISNMLFLIKPAGYKVPVNREMIPQFFHFLDKTDPSKPINFALNNSVENSKFTAVFFGDPQARGLKEVNYINHDVVEELIGTTASFGVSLGDITADGPELFHEINRGISQIGIPWYNTFGNHDYDRGSKTNDEADDSYERVYGPSTYAFEYGQVVFVDFNNIFFTEGRYKPHFTGEQISFLKNYLAFVPENKLIVLMMHAPVVACDNRDKIFDLISNRKYTFSVSGHVHEQINLFVTAEMGWKGPVAHHHLINGTVSGSWWCGAIDETGIPHATMNDGTPNGYSMIHFDGNTYSVQYKVARKPENYQMNIYLNDNIIPARDDSRQVLVNVFAGSPRSKVEMKISGTERWIEMNHFETPDPECERMSELSPILKETVKGKVLEDVLGYTMDKPGKSTHIWKGEIPPELTPGTYTLIVRTTDMYGKTWISQRVFRVSKS